MEIGNYSPERAERAEGLVISNLGFGVILPGVKILPRSFPRHRL